MLWSKTSNWQKLVSQVTEDGRSSYPAIAAEYADAQQAIRVHCGAEQQVLMRVNFYLTSREDIEALETFLKHFGLPRNGYGLVDAYRNVPLVQANGVAPSYDGTGPLTAIAPPYQGR
jgi:hypothetical protein